MIDEVSFIQCNAANRNVQDLYVCNTFIPQTFVHEKKTLSISIPVNYEDLNDKTVYVAYKKFLISNV